MTQGVNAGALVFGPHTDSPLTVHQSVAEQPEHSLVVGSFPTVSSLKQFETEILDKTLLSVLGRTIVKNPLRPIPYNLFLSGKNAT